MKPAAGDEKLVFRDKALRICFESVVTRDGQNAAQAFLAGLFSWKLAKQVGHLDSG